MSTFASTLARTGVIALGVLTGFSGMGMTAPFSLIDKPAVATGFSLPIELAGYRYRKGGYGRYGRGGYGRYGRYGGYGRYGHYNNGNVGIYLGLGLPLYGGYGGYGGYYPRYYNNGYYPRRYYQRRYYRSGSAHVQWCYNRYRSYSEYDNTFQPYDGPRRQCYSPYS